MEKSQKFSLSIYILILVLLGLHTVISDWFTYLLNFDYTISILISLFFVIILFLSVKKFICINYQWEKEDLIFFLILFVLLIMHIPMADEMYDTFNYHLYLQERPFVSKLIEDFFPGRYINSFSYAFPDRMFYLFRFLLGYRLGVILNYIVMVVMYYQIKDILKDFFIKQSKLVPIFSMITVFSLSILEQIDNYYVDLLSLVFLLELGRIAIKKKKNDSFFIKTIFYMLVAGMAFAVKVSNAFFIIVFSIVYLINNWKNISKMRWKELFLYFVTFCFPFILYAFYTWIETGNPVFPFYNTIFHSLYYPNSNWLDTRFGPKTFFELILWPFYAVFYPARVADTHICEPMWAIAYFIAIFYIIYNIVQILRKKQLPKITRLMALSLITIVLYLVWSKFLLGYTRYAIIVVTFSTFNALLISYEFFQKKKYLIFTIFFIGFLWNSAYFSYQYLYSGKNLFYDNIANNTFSNYIYNVKHIFDSNQQIITFPEKSTWGVIAENSGDCIMINNTIPILNLTWGAATEDAQKILEEDLKKYDHIYTAVSYLQLDYFLERLNEYSWQIKNHYATVVPSNLEELGSYYVFEISKGNEKNSKFEGYDKLEFPVSSNDIEGYFGIHPRIRNLSTPCSFSIYGVKNDDEVLLQTIENLEAGMLNFIKIKNDGFSKIIIKSSSINTEPLNIIWIQLKGSN